MSDINRAYLTLKKLGARDSNADDASLGELASTHYWDVLKNTVIAPKIATLHALVEETGKVYSGEMSEEEYGRTAVRARFAADHLQDIIERVEQAQAAINEDAQREHDERTNE